MAQYRQSGHHYSNGNSDHVAVGIRASPSQHQHKSGRPRRSTRSDKGRLGFSIGGLIAVLCLVLLLTLLAYYYLSTDSKEIYDHRVEDDDTKNDLDFLTNVTRTVKVLGFGQGSVTQGRDSRYWDRDDRRRDEDYNEDEVDHATGAAKNESSHEDHNPATAKNGKEKASQDATSKGVNQRGVGLYNEDGRKELKMYEAEYEASLKNVGLSEKENGLKNELVDDDDDDDFEEQTEAVETDNEYDDGIDSHDPHKEQIGDSEQDKENYLHVGQSRDAGGGEAFKGQGISKDIRVSQSHKGSISLKSRALGNFGANYQRISGRQSTIKSRTGSKRKGKRRSCEMKFLNSTAQLVEPFESRKFARFSLQYVDMEEKPDGLEQWEPKFAGHPTWQDREKSFLAHDQKINCGFVKAPEGSSSTGFDLAEDDTNYISRCHVAVISCIFGNSDRLRSPFTKAVTKLSRKNVCFVMFTDESSLQTLSSEGQIPDRAGFIGLWRIVVVKNLPYTDMRRVGKIPKLLAHRLFPFARYSIWLDSKLRLQMDPLLVLEYLLWRKGYEYAISNHYDRHCVWEEVAQNKRLNKYNHTIIDQQFVFYQDDGLKRFNASDPNKLLPSNVPEGSMIVRAHTPMSNLFSCLWFNEVERFTPRDQLSFAYTYQKLRRMNPGKPFYLNMFKDCERRAIAKLFRHRSEEKRNILQQQATE